MAVRNVHERLLPVPPERAGALIDTLASGAGDLLWPHRSWPAMRFDRPLGPGARGGHGPIRYTVEAHVPSVRARFVFTAPRGLNGYHEFAVLPAPDDPGVALLRHTLVADLTGPARLSWPLCFRWLHDALIEDSLDRAEHACTGTVARPAVRSPYVRLLRAAARRGRGSSGGGPAGRAPGGR
jgi:hypothetical protein